MKPKILLAIYLGLVLCNPNQLSSQEVLDFTHLTVENGLSQSGVLSITQDKYGFMWFGTRDGLNKYDGQTFEVFKHAPEDTTSLSSSLEISALFCESKEASVMMLLLQFTRIVRGNFGLVQKMALIA
jgi:ligand-binding sensor domain-containing protein